MVEEDNRFCVVSRMTLLDLVGPLEFPNLARPGREVILVDEKKGQMTTNLFIQVSPMMTCADV
ncbi:MAG: hypothetical protein ABR879_05215 [Methanomassiliicoccales archaeon]